jgi:hypothetical protein
MMPLTLVGIQLYVIKCMELEYKAGLKVKKRIKLLHIISGKKPSAVVHICKTSNLGG